MANHARTEPAAGCSALPALLLVASLGAPGWTAHAQTPDPPPFAPPIADTWRPIASMGQPAQWHPAMGLSFGVDRFGEDLLAGPTVSGGLHRSLLNPVAGALGVSVQAYVGQRASDVDGGMRVFLDSPAFFLHLGADWNHRLRRVRPVVSTSFPPRRGGWFHRGGLVRLDLVPGSDRRLAAGVWVPVGQPYSGRTRPAAVSVELPTQPPGLVRLPPPEDEGLRELVADFQDAMVWITALHNIYWLTERTGISRDERVLRSRQILTIFRAELAEREALSPDHATYPREVEHYHRTLERALATASGRRGPEAAALADQARTAAMEEMVFPYNATVGQFRDPDSLSGLAARARARFTAWLDLSGGLDARQRSETLRVLDAWLRSFEEVRLELEASTGDGRVQWIPLALVLRPEEHDTRDKVDALVERAVGRGFTRGNAVQLLGALPFQEELRRSLLEADDYHVLWIHDFRGRNTAGDTDRIGYLQAAAYLRALLRNVRRFDETGRLPSLFIILDQFFYEENDGRLWMDLLERPLTHRVRLPRRANAMVGALEALQDSLRHAVEESRRLQAHAEVFGPDWIEAVVKVHVNITNPSDFAYRSRRLLGLPMGGDNLMRDHRKLFIRDVTPGDPARGEVVLTGVGVGEHYASPTWDDRTIRIRGPAALAARDEARRVLEANRLDPIPASLAARPLATDYAGRIEALEAAGATARVLQVHNDTGWGQKDATFLQMLLWDLLPPGSLIYVPDSLWTSPEWMAQLVSAAFRGCRVLIVAPALENAPSAGFPQMSEARELLVALLVVEETLGDVIREAGGDLRVGLFTRRAALDDLPAYLMELEERFAVHPFLHETFPLHPAAWETIGRHRDAEGGPGAVDPFLAPDVGERQPMLHQKTQFFASTELVEALGSHPGVAEVLDAKLAHVARGAAAEGAGGSDPGRFPFDSPATEPTRRILELAGALPAPLRDEAPVYLLVGSLNKNVRSMALDGEVIAVTSGEWALQGYLDFLLFSGSVSWLASPEEMDVLFPPYSDMRRLLGRFLLRIL